MRIHHAKQGLYVFHLFLRWGILVLVQLVYFFVAHLQQDLFGFVCLKHLSRSALVYCVNFDTLTH